MRSTSFSYVALAGLVCVVHGATACGSVAGDSDAAVGDPDAAGACTTPDADGDGVCDAEDVCPGSDDSVDSDADGVPDGCDACAGANDSTDTDSDGVPDGCDVCAGSDDGADVDADTVPDGCDVCAANDDLVDTDADSVPDGCDACPGFDDAVDSDNDTVADGCDLCPGFDDTIDTNNNGTPDACEGNCDGNTEVQFQGKCYYLDGNGGTCVMGYVLAPQSVLTDIATQFVGKTYKTQVSDNCCIVHANQTAELQDWGMETDCNAPGPFMQGPLLGGAGCTDANNMNPAQLTFCRSQ